jgi:hypothetical protein
MHSASDPSSDIRESTERQRRLTDFLELDGLNDADMSDAEVEKVQARLYSKERDKFSHANAKLDASWKPNQKKKHKVDTEVESKCVPSIYHSWSNWSSPEMQLEHSIV